MLYVNWYFHLTRGFGGEILLKKERNNFVVKCVISLSGVMFLVDVVYYLVSGFIFDALLCEY